MNRIERQNDNVDENPDEFNQLNENIKQAYKQLIGNYPNIKKVRTKYNPHVKLNCKK